MIEMLLTGFTSVLTIKIILLIVMGVALGLVFGSIPGLTATMAIAICLPITYGMDPIAGMSLLMGLYIGGVSGGLIPAILLKLPERLLQLQPPSMGIRWHKKVRREKHFHSQLFRHF